MEKDLLQAVIEVESEIQHTLESERKKAAEWLETVRVSLRNKLESAKRDLSDEFTKSLETRRKTFELKAKEKTDAIDSMTEILQNLSGDDLQDAVREFLVEILPSGPRE